VILHGFVNEKLRSSFDGYCRESQYTSPSVLEVFYFYEESDHLGIHNKPFKLSIVVVKQPFPKFDLRSEKLPTVIPVHNTPSIASLG